MDRPRAARRAATGLGAVYVLLGAVETVRLTVTGDGGFVFWFGTLVGGGALLLWGSRAGRPPAVVVGALLGLPATAWTVVVPLAALAVVALTILSTAPQPLGPEPDGSPPLQPG